MTSSSVPTTALVVDFICLFTHDLKRKQKRWQDGVLKYHTFNKRVMVYDDRNHFIGDAHWQGGGDLEPGDEFELDRGAAIVQVSDCTGQREQDLTELLDKRAKEVEKRRTNAGTTRTPGSTAAVTQTPRNDQNAPHFQLRHRPLNDIVGGTLRIGRAVISPHSPYEQRKMAESPGQQQDSPSEDARPSKRRRREESPPSKMGHARALFGTALTLTPFSSSIPSARSLPLHDRAAARPKVASAVTRDSTSHASRRADRGSKSPPPSSNTEEMETSALRQTAPRRVFTQRASLKELLAGNEHSRTSELPRTRDTLPKSRSKASKQARPQQPPEDEVVSLLTQEPVSSKPRRDAAANSPRNARGHQESNADKPSKSRTSAPKTSETVDSDKGDEESPETDDEAFLNWLAQSEDSPAMAQAPAPPMDNRPPRPKKAKGDPVPAIQRPAKESTRKVAQEPIVVDEDEDEDVEALPHPKTSRIRPESAASETIKRKETSTAEPHGTKRTLSTDSAAATESDTDKPPPAKEPRTELRIRSRQRRGLLMIAQSKQVSRSTLAGRSVPFSSVAGSDTHNTSHTVARAASIFEEPQAAQRISTETAASKKVPMQQVSAEASERQRSLEEPDDQPIEIRNPNTEEAVREKDLNNESEALEEPEVEVVPSDDAVPVSELSEDRRSPTPPRRRTNPSRHTRKRAAPVVFSDNEGETSAFDSPPISDDEEEGLPAALKAGRKPEPKPSSGPRITKMSRKSVKSREIIGFVMPDEDFPIAGFNIGHAGPVEAKKPSNDPRVGEKPPGKARDAPKAPGNKKSVSDGLEAEQPQTNGKPPEVEQPSIKEEEPGAIGPSTTGKKPETIQQSAHSKAYEAAEPPSQEKERATETVQPSMNAKQPERVHPTTKVQKQEASASETGLRGPKVQEPSTKEKESKEVQPTTSEKEPETVQPLTKENNPETPAPPTSGKRLEAARPPTDGKEQEEKQRPRIVNPATRGRKAARKQDAAGLPPQTLVQFEPATSSRIAPAQPPKKSAPASNVPQSELPVFCRANGGAWSRHAEDLLGMTRPTRRMPRR
ncbi:uncharacterized protein BKA55DRAFT_219059 [Fusarium redolens]|uniref:5'-3' DNA helicase ZGRF1-like N-terminal domain-containing protein n=1 Tax=Fusarium redolens TaxID=48865 RepID=A0A9P9KK48_FUSRE|nr:uncharacterized protein BKA55DRAFT_219059 [Fusarium redolens]KAH7264688.1 hypothetical protein BKA55DRAFT_219059 [Fusarium redolens]